MRSPPTLNHPDRSLPPLQSASASPLIPMRHTRNLRIRQLARYDLKPAQLSTDLPHSAPTTSRLRIQLLSPLSPLRQRPPAAADHLHPPPPLPLAQAVARVPPPSPRSPSNVSVAILPPPPPSRQVLPLPRPSRFARLLSATRAISIRFAMSMEETPMLPSKRRHEVEVTVHYQGRKGMTSSPSPRRAGAPVSRSNGGERSANRHYHCRSLSRVEHGASRTTRISPVAPPPHPEVEPSRPSPHPLALGPTRQHNLRKPSSRHPHLPGFNLLHLHPPTLQLRLSLVSSNRARRGRRRGKGRRACRL